MSSPEMGGGGGGGGGEKKNNKLQKNNNKQHTSGLGVTLRYKTHTHIIGGTFLHKYLL